MTNPNNALNFVFFGTPHLAVTILEELKNAGFIPGLIVSAPDKPQGRHLVITPSPVKIWAEEHAIPLYQPASLKTEDVFTTLSEQKWDLFIVAAYGKIIPQNILDIPTHKTLNVHPSLLPKLRGSAPIEGAILNDMKDTGVTIMRLDAEMDHGPIIAQEPITLPMWPLPATELESLLAHHGGKLLAQTIPGWLNGTMPEKEQDHSQATFIKKVEKTDAELDLNADAYQNYLKICAYTPWPRAYFFVSHQGKPMRVVIVEAHLEINPATNKNDLIIDQVIPEGKKQMSYADFLRGLKN